jgi:hypothetical protein
MTSRWVVTLAAISAWLALSNHCALGALAPSVESAPEMSGCPMHSTPAQKKPATKTPCCKDVRAIVAKCVKASGATQLVASSKDVMQIFARPARVALEIEALATGPPACFSFAESVLQESMPSHAPPLS